MKGGSKKEGSIRYMIRRNQEAEIDPQKKEENHRVLTEILDHIQTSKHGQSNTCDQGAMKDWGWLQMRFGDVGDACLR